MAKTYCSQKKKHTGKNLKIKLIPQLLHPDPHMKKKHNNPEK